MHLSFFPKADEALIDERQKKKRMDLVRTLVGLGRGTREKRTYQGKTAVEGDSGRW